jgi:hypothetical protein
VSDRRGELDVAHALAPHARQRHFNAALLAGHAAILDALVLAAQALVILDRPEDAGAEQAVALRLERAVVDRLRLLDLADDHFRISSGLAIAMRIDSKVGTGALGLNRLVTSWLIL